MGGNFVGIWVSTTPALLLAGSALSLWHSLYLVREGEKRLEVDLEAGAHGALDVHHLGREVCWECGEEGG